LCRQKRYWSGKFWLINNFDDYAYGHLLGLGHVNAKKPACLTTGNASAAACYGVTDYDKYAVMGLGMQLRDEHANPWRRAIVEISGKGRVEISTDWLPRMTRQYRRSVSDILTDKPVVPSVQRGTTRCRP